MTLRAGGPEYVPLRTFRDDDLLDPGSDPLIALMGALSALYEGERVVARLLLRSLGPDWSQAHMEKAHKRPGMEPREPAYTYQTKPLQMDGITMAVLGIGALAALKGYLWVQDGEIWKAALLGTGTALGLAAGGWAWWRWKRARSRVEDPILIQEKVSRIAFDAELQVTAIVPSRTGPQRAGELLGPVAAAYRHYDNPAGARFKVGHVRPVAPDRENLHPPGPGLFGGRSVLGVREIACLWHPPGAGDETPLVERSGARALSPSAKGVRGGALVGDTTAGARREIRFPDDLLRRHHLYVARTRMGKSTLMHHVVTHKMQEKAAGRDGDAIVVIDPHTDLVAGILEHVPDSLAGRVRLIDLSDETRSPGINLLDTRIFADRDRTADSVVRVAKGLWEQWGPRMQSILEQTVKTLHEANEQMEAEQHVPKESTSEQLGELLEGIAERFAEYRPFMVGDVGRYTRMGRLPVELLNKVLQETRWKDPGSSIAIDRLYEWLGVVSDPGLQLPERDKTLLRLDLGWNSDALKDLIAYGVDTCVRRGEDCTDLIDRHLFGARPWRYGRWCSEMALGADGGKATSFYLLELLHCVVDGTRVDGLTLEGARAGLAANEALLNQFDEMVSRRSRVEAQTERRTEPESAKDTESLGDTAEQRALQAQIAAQASALHAGRGVPDLLHQAAVAYLGIQENSAWKTPRQRLGDLVGSRVDLIDLLLAGMEGTVTREDLPSNRVSISLRWVSG